MKYMEDNIVGKRIKVLRESVKMSQVKLAAANGKMAQPAVNRYEGGHACPSFETLVWYADYFDVSLDYIFGRTDNPRGELYANKPQYTDDSKELKEFVEMCFDTNSPVNAKLKETIIKILEEQRK